MKPYSLVFAIILTGCVGETLPVEDYEWDLPEGFPAIRVPDDNPMTESKVELGRRLFYDTRLSADDSLSCATCHRQELAFTDGLPRAKGVFGDLHPRSAMSLTNVAYASTLNWANPIETRLEHQVLTPLFGEAPPEHGIGGMEDIVIARLKTDATLARLFDTSFPDEGVSVATVAKALAAFQRTLISGNSAYDRWVRGDDSAMSASALRGKELFFSERLECFHCHGGFNFSQSVDHQSMIFDESQFHNNGLYNLGSEGDYPEPNQGLYEFTGLASDKGRFKPPTLRNIGVTAPYMHDGSISTLAEVIDHYAAGGRNITEGLHQGDGAQNPNKHEFVTGFFISEDEKNDLLAFLNALTDHEFLERQDFGPPK